MGYETLYTDENITVLLPDYLSDSLSDSDTESENERENAEDNQLSEDSDTSGNNDYSDILANQILISEQIDNLNSNVCIMNDNLITLNSNILYLIGINALILFFSLVQIVYRIFVNTLCLGKA